MVIRKADTHGNPRVFMVHTGRKTQPVNVCTPAGVDGQYEAWVYLESRFWVDAAWFGRYTTFEDTMTALRERD